MLESYICIRSSHIQGLGPEILRGGGSCLQNFDTNINTELQKDSSSLGRRAGHSVLNTSVSVFVTMTKGTEALKVNTSKLDRSKGAECMEELQGFFSCMQVRCCSSISISKNAVA